MDQSSKFLIQMELRIHIKLLKIRSAKRKAIGLTYLLLGCYPL
ncbi:hypothetical protein SAMN04487969_1258 [Paenibacillus algorifonticola]|uniref:Uncharacterized protein n=1 Tax=Paenibacillus algorifonticola TaxID=684063 RepID=A0A1I2HR04_9BACL|nr:hypothetical protein SAMN04487969_1258 [Paenibacillus algorifonticola]